jgi:hypothetical protein
MTNGPVHKIDRDEALRLAHRDRYRLFQESDDLVGLRAAVGGHVIGPLHADQQGGAGARCAEQPETGVW